MIAVLVQDLIRNMHICLSRCKRSWIIGQTLLQMHFNAGSLKKL